MTPRGLTPALAVVAVVVGVAAVVGVGFANPVPTPPIRTDTLGPDSGEAVPDYLDRARDSVASVDGPGVGVGLVHEGTHRRRGHHVDQQCSGAGR